MATNALSYDCSKSPPEWVSWRILDPKYPNYFIHITRRSGQKTCDHMIRGIVKLDIINQGKFKEIEIEGKSALVFLLDTPGSGKQLVSKYNLKWGRLSLSNAAIASIGAATFIGAAVLGAGVHHSVSDKSIFSYFL